MFAWHLKNAKYVHLRKKKPEENSRKQTVAKSLLLSFSPFSDILGVDLIWKCTATNTKPKWVKKEGKKNNREEMKREKKSNNAHRKWPTEGDR